MVQNFMLESSCSQLVNENTRSEIIQGGYITKSCKDHCYTNVPGKVSKPEMTAVGNSDHLGIVVTKYAKLGSSKPKTVKKRSYKDFKVVDFQTYVLESMINNAVTACEELDEAAEMFESMFKIFLRNMHL